MSAIVSNLGQISAALLLLGGLALPTGWLFLRCLRLPSLPPVAVLAGLLILPFYFNLLGALVPLGLAARILAWLVLNALLFYLMRGERAAYPQKIPVLVWGIAISAALLTLLPLVLHDVQVGENWVYVMAGDWVKHIGVGNALATSDALPPPNPFLSTEPQLRYYYFAYILPGMVTPISGESITVTSSLTALAVLVAFCLPFVVFVYGQLVGLSAKAAGIAVFLVILVSGLDFIYVLAERHASGFWVEHIDFWANHDLRRLNAISNMFIWTPQHTLGVGGFVLVMMLLAERVGWRQGAGLAVVIAALCGTSSFVWFGVLAGLGVFVLLESAFLRYSGGWRALAGVGWLVLGVIASLVLSLPYLQVVGERQESAFAISISPTVSGWQYGGVFSQLFGGNALTYTLDFPLQMALEFGLVLFTGAAGWWMLRKNWRESAALRLWSVLLVVFFLIVLAIRPDRPDSNNYAARVAPMAWVLLGILSGFWWMAARRGWLVRGLGGVLLVLGVAATLYEPWIEQAPHYLRLAGIESSTPRYNVVTASQRELYRFLDETLTRDEVYQIGWEADQATYFVGRRAGVTAGYLALLYVSRDTLFYVDALAALQLGFDAPTPQESALGFRHIGIDYIALDANMRLVAENAPDFAEFFTLVFENADYRVYKIEGIPYEHTNRRQRHP